MSDNEEFVGVPRELEVSDDEVDGAGGHTHNKLLQRIESLASKKKATSFQRSEPTVKASEFNLTPASVKVNIRDLVGALKNTSSHAEVKKKLGKIQVKKDLLSAPLPKNQIEKIQRNVAYEATTAEISKWDPVVTKNRKAEQLEFPLVKPNLKLRTTNEMSKGYKPRTPLEIEVAKLLSGSKNVASRNSELTPAEQQAMQAMNLEEAKERRAELQKYRALLTYKEAKARRQKKIKSKKFHRILRKEKLKNDKKQMETLQETDPEAYADMLMKMHKDRIEERISLKHRGGSKFMKRQQIYGKHDDKSRQAVADMLEKHQELRQKLKTDGSSSEDDDDVMDGVALETELAHRMTPSGQPANDSSKNPWMSSESEANIGAKVYTKLPVITNKEMLEEGEESESEEEEVEENKEKEILGIDEIFEDSERRLKKKTIASLNAQKEKEEKAKSLRNKRFEEKKAKREEKRKEKEKESESESESSDSDDDDSEAESDPKEKVMNENEKDSNEGFGISNSLTRKQTLEDFENMSDLEEDSNDKSASKTGYKSVAKTAENKKMIEKPPQVDPKKFLTVSTPVKSDIAPELIGDSGEVEDEQEDQQRLTIAQAFADDDVVEEFKIDKTATEEKDKPKDIDLTLPGWGEWGGTGLQASKRKRKRFVIKAPPAPPRMDSHLQGVIISESKDNTIAKHQVKNLPFPFTNIHQFESSIRAPIGKTWNPENAYRNLIKPKVVTRLGTVIDPIDKANVFKKDKSGEIPDNNKNEPPSKKTRKGGHQQKKHKR